jgi:2-dehydro-3-deoxygluconokinase
VADLAAVAGPEVVTLGECLVSFVAADLGPLAGSPTFHAYPAGAEANVAVGLARLGRRVAFIGRVGTDGLGTRIVRALRGEGVDISGLAVDPAGPTGLMIRERRGIGSVEVHYARAGSAGSHLGSADVVAAESRGTFAEARWLHLTGITPALSSSCRAAVGTALETGRASGLTISLDLNLRRRLWNESEAAPVLRELAARVDVVVGDEDEANLVSGSPPGSSPEALAQAILELGPSVVVLKLGPEGALALGAGSGPVSATGLPVPTVVDPVGAGDAFCAGFIDARLDGLDLVGSLARANACAAAAIAAEGDQTGLPTRAELDRLLASGGPDTLR